MKRPRFCQQMVVIGLTIWLGVGCATPLPATPIPVSVHPQPTLAVPTAAEPTAAPPPAAASTATTVQPATAPVQFTLMITGTANPLSTPVGVAVDTEGSIYIVDTGNSRVQKFDRNGRFLTMWGTYGDGAGQFYIVRQDEGRVAVDAADNVYVLDVDNHRIQKFDSNGKFLLMWGSTGTGDGQFTELSDIAIDSQNNVYVVDFQNSNVQKFDSTGRFLLRWGATGYLDGLFTDPASVAVDSQGNILVVELSGRLQKFDRNGKFLSGTNLPMVNKLFMTPYNIALDGQDNLYVADNPSDRIVKLDRNTNLLATWGGPGEGEGQFYALQDVAVDKAGNVYVTDSSNNCMQEFRQPSYRP